MKRRRFLQYIGDGIRWCPISIPLLTAARSAFAALKKNDPARQPV